MPFEVKKRIGSARAQLTLGPARRCEQRRRPRGCPPGRARRACAGTAARPARRPPTRGRARQRPRFAARGLISSSKYSRIAGASSISQKASRLSKVASRSRSTRSSRSTVWKRAGRGSPPSPGARTPASMARIRSAHQSIAPPMRSGPQVLVVIDDATSRPSRKTWMKRACGKRSSSTRASFTLCELISTRPGRPSSSATGYRRSRKRPRHASAGSASYASSNAAAAESNRRRVETL